MRVKPQEREHGQSFSSIQADSGRYFDDAVNSLWYHVGVYRVVKSRGLLENRWRLLVFRRTVGRLHSSGNL